MLADPAARRFLAETGVILVGILNALTFERGVDRLHEPNLAREARTATKESIWRSLCGEFVERSLALGPPAHRVDVDP
jgi:hypothetical protein